MRSAWKQLSCTLWGAVMCLRVCVWGGGGAMATVLLICNPAPPFPRETAAFGTMKWRTKHLTCTTCPCTPARRARRAWATCPREVWRSTSARSPGETQGLALCPLMSRSDRQQWNVLTFPFPSGSTSSMSGSVSPSSWPYLGRYAHIFLDCHWLSICHMDSLKMLVIPNVSPLHALWALIFFFFHLCSQSDLFQEDLYPDTIGPEPSVEASDWFTGKDGKPILISLKDGFVATKTKEFRVHKSLLSTTTCSSGNRNGDSAVREYRQQLAFWEEPRQCCLVDAVTTFIYHTSLDYHSLMLDTSHCSPGSALHPGGTETVEGDGGGADWESERAGEQVTRETEQGMDRRDNISCVKNVRCFQVV